LPGTKSKIKCIKCNTIGSTLSKQWVKRNVNIPKIENIKTISEAWDYSGKIFLKIRELQILFPPTDDFEINNMFTQFEKLCPLSKEDFNAFINRNMNTISKNALYKKEAMEKKGDIKFHRFGLPKTSGKITRLSVSALYCAIVCFSLRDIFESSGNINHQYQYVKSICNIFRFFYLSLRNTIPKLKWVNIIEDIEDYGYNAASSLNSIDTIICNNCSNVRKNEKELVFLEEIGRENNEVIFKCPKCGKSDRHKRKFSVQHLKKTFQKQTQEYVDVDDSLDNYEEFTIRYSKYLTTVFSEEFLEHFAIYEQNAKNDLLTKKEYYAIGHYDSNKKHKKRWCIIKNLAELEIDDQKYYSEYIPSIKRMVQSYKDNPHTKIFNDLDWEEKVEKILIDIGWSPKYAQDKIHADCMNVALNNKSNIA
jgi:hypothetical protein